MADEKSKNGNKSWFSKTEGRLFAYPALMARHRDLAATLKEMYPLGAQGFGDGVGIRAVGLTGDGAAKWVVRQESVANQLAAVFPEVLREFELMQGFLELCTPDEQEFIDLRYIKRWARSTVMREMAISSTTYYRLRDVSITRAAVIFGYLTHKEYAEMLAI